MDTNKTDENKCKQLMDDFYKKWESSGGYNFPSILEFKKWLKAKNPEEQYLCNLLISEFEKTEKPFYKNPNIKLDEMSLATFVDWVRKRIANKKASKEDWAGNFLSSN